MTNKLNCVIIDDEIAGRVVLKELLTSHCPDIVVAGEAEDITQGYEEILAKQPDFILLDIQMPGGSGFELLKRYKTIDFDVIFVTSYDKYAINAIKFSALDYLLKPLEVPDLISAIEKVWVRKNNKIEKDTLVINLLNNLEGTKAEKKIAIHHQDRVRLINLDEVLCFEAASNYTRLHCLNGQNYMVARTLKDFEEFVSHNEKFFRINKSVIVNLQYVNEYSKGEPCIIYLNNSKEYEISRRKKTELAERIKK
jgi:two-component system LytT family response regulator